MVKQNIPAQFDVQTFFKNGAILQIAPNQFKVISGPFQTVELNENELITNLASGQSLIFQPDFWDFLQSQKAKASFLMGQQSYVFDRNTVVELCELVEPLKPKVSWQNVNSTAFKIQFEWSQQKFSEKILSKTVPIIVQTCKTRFTFQQLAGVLKNLLNENHFGWAYGLWQEGTGYLGQTPELILNWNAKKHSLLTCALAGTMQNNLENSQNILKDSKIKQEHKYVIDDVLNKLKMNFATQELKQSQTEILTLKHLIHLKTDFECQNVSLLKAFQTIQLLHPTAALGLFPQTKIQMQRFSELSLQNERQNFAAPFALLEKDFLLCVAAIRNFYFSPIELNIFSGCGVTEQSFFESELAELELKRESVKRMMGIAE